MTLARPGIDIRSTTGGLLFDCFLQDAAGADVVSGTTSLFLYEVQDDGSLKSFDWVDSTFKATALTTETQSLTHRKGNGGTTNTGYWSYVLTTLTGFTASGIYLAKVKNGTLAQVRKFQFGGAEGDATPFAFTLSNGFTLSQWAEALICLVGAGKLSGASAGSPCTPKVRNLADSKDIVTVTGDGIGNRSVVSWTP